MGRAVPFDYVCSEKTCFNLSFLFKLRLTKLVYDVGTVLVGTVIRINKLFFVSA